MMSIQSLGKYVLSLGFLAGMVLAMTGVSQAQSRVNTDKVARNNGASFWANERTSRNIQHARDYSRGIQRYSTQSPMVYSQVLQPETQMLGQQLQSIQRDMVIVKKECESMPKAVEQVKKVETQVAKAVAAQATLHEECCKTSPDGKTCENMSTKLTAALNELKAEHDKLLKELGHEEASHEHQSAPHEHHDAASRDVKK
jgi:hypothetical protein